MSRLIQRAPIHTGSPENLNSSARKRRVLSILFFAWIFFLLFEGAIRKWIFPAASTYIFFARVPIAILILVLALAWKFWPKYNPPLFFVYAFSFGSVFLVPLQIELGNYSSAHYIIAAYGWISYFLYIPLAFVMGEVFRKEEIEKLFKWLIWIAIFSVPLVFLQFTSDPMAPINTGEVVGNEAGFSNLGSGLGRVRPMGLFSSALGQGVFLPIVVLAVFGIFKSGYIRGAFKYRFRLLAAASCFFLIILSQSRSAIGLCLVVVAISIYADYKTGTVGKVAKVLAIIISLFILVLTLWPVVYPDSYDAFVIRSQGAAESESDDFALGIVGRFLYQFYAFVYYIQSTPVQGYLLGMAGNAAASLPWVQRPVVQWTGYGGWGEDAWSRHVIELGAPLGILFILLRIYLSVWILRRSVKVAKKAKDALPIIAAGYAAFMLASLIVTGQGTVNGFTWLAFGLALAIIKDVDRRTRQASAYHRRSIND